MLADRWESELGVSAYFATILREGIRDVPARPVWGNGEMSVIPQTPEELRYGMEELEKGLRPDVRNWEELSRDEVEELKARGYMVSSSFVHWEGFDENEGRKGRFVQIFSELTA